MKKFFILIGILPAIIFTACIDDELLDDESQELSNKTIMQNLDIEDPSIWNTLATQSISIDELNEEDGLKSASAYSEYPSGGKYYYAIFEDLYPSEGDYDMNDLILESKLGLKYNGSKITGYLNTSLINRGGSISLNIGLMFYNVSGKTYTRIDYDKIKVNGEQLSEPWSVALESLDEEWTIEFEFEHGNSSIWINYFIESDEKILSSGFAPVNIKSFDIPYPTYLSDYNLPWGLEIEAKSFAIPNEKELFLNAYPEFEEWATSNASKNKSWFNNPDPDYTHN